MESLSVLWEFGLKKRKCQDLPCLAHFGDRVAHSVGVSHEAEIMEFTLGLNDKFVVIASDGVWEFLSNEDVAHIVYPFYE